MVRMTFTRVFYKDETIKPDVKPVKQSFGDVFIVNDNDGRYKGEIHVVLQDMAADKKKNIVAKVTKDDQILIKYIGA
jgi:hypothetical protein